MRRSVEKPRDLEPQALEIMQEALGKIDPESSSAHNVEVFQENPWRLISYSTIDNSRRDRGGNVLTAMHDFDLDIAPEVLIKVAGEILDLKKTLEQLGFNISQAGMEQDSTPKRYEVVADKLVPIEKLRTEVSALAKLLSFHQ